MAPRPTASDLRTNLGVLVYACCEVERPKGRSKAVKAERAEAEAAIFDAAAKAWSDVWALARARSAIEHERMARHTDALRPVEEGDG